MARVYLETSFISACVTTRDDPASVYRRETSLEWWESQAHQHERFVSAEVTAELGHPRFQQREAALRLIADVARVEITPEAVGLAEALVKAQVMPSPVAGDALHVATAIVHAMDYLLTWNVRHLANPNKLRHLRTVCLRLGLVPPSIVTPDLLWEEEP